MKKILICLAIAGVGLLNTGCNDWLDVLPKNGVVLVFLGCGGENIPGWEAVWPIMAKREGS